MITIKSTGSVIASIRIGTISTLLIIDFLRKLVKFKKESESKIEESPNNVG